MLSHRRRDKFSKIAGMNARTVLSWVDFWTVTLMWKNGQNETEHSTWMLLFTGTTVHRWWSELSVEPSGQKTKQREVAGEYVYRKRTATKMSSTLALNRCSLTPLSQSYRANFIHRTTPGHCCVRNRTCLATLSARQASWHNFFRFLNSSHSCFTLTSPTT